MIRDIFENVWEWERVGEIEKDRERERERDREKVREINDIIKAHAEIISHATESEIESLSSNSR